jgi:hypothetical protein
MSKKDRSGSRLFQHRYKGDVVEVWYGPPDDFESELITAIHYTFIPELIATLRGCLGDKARSYPND